jgi:hypothetical protein
MLEPSNTDAGGKREKHDESGVVGDHGIHSILIEFGKKSRSAIP